MGRGQLLSDVRRQQQDKGHCDKQDENKSLHGCTLLSPFAPCRRSGQRVAAQKMYTLIPLDFQGKAGVPRPSRTYPELFALLGGKLPDLRGLFLRGHGGKSAGLMVKQDDAGRNVTGTFSSDALFSSQFNGSYSPTGAFFSETVNGAHIASDGHAGFQVMKLDASRIWGKNHATDSANGEFRPVNQAVRYLVRARP